MSKGNHKTAVLGLGRCGGKVAVTIAKKFAGTSLKVAAVDSDKAFLASLEGVTTIAAGSVRTDGLGCGGNPVTGEKAIRDDIGLIKNFVNGMGCVIVVGGLGKGFATGAAPILAETLKDLDVVQLFAMTTPFVIEGGVPREKADEAIEKLQNSAKNVINISNDLLYSKLPAETAVTEVFSLAERAISQGICALLDILNHEPNDAVALEFSTITENIGRRQAECALAFASSETKDFTVLADQLLTSPLSGGDNYICDSDALLIKVTSNTFTAAETTECTEILSERLKCGDKVRFGFHFNPEVTETTISALIIKYNDPFSKGKKRTGKGKNQLELGLVERNLGVFTTCKVKAVDEEGNNLDIPTFQRLGISLDDM